MFFAYRSLPLLLLSLVLVGSLGQGCRKQHKDTGPVTAAADALLAAGKPMEAIAAYKALPPSDASTRGIGLAFVLLRRWPEANAALAPYVKTHPQDLSARTAWVSSLVGSGDLVTGRTEAAALAGVATQDLSIQLLAAAVADDDAARKTALDRLASFKLDPSGTESDSFELLITRAALSRALGKTEAAEAANAAAQNAPLHSAGEAMSLAEAYQQVGQTGMAERLMLKTIEDPAALPAALRATAEISLELNKPERVAALLARIPAAQAIPPVDGLIAARAKLALGESDAATADLTSLIATLERDKRPMLVSRARLWLARAYLAKGKVAEAKQALLAITDPGMAFERDLAIADIELNAGNAQATIDRLKPLIAQNAQAVAPQLMLASAHVKAGHPEEAQRVLSELATARPDDPRVPYTLGTVLETNGDRAGAEREYKRALSVAPGSLAPLRRLIELLDGSQRSTEVEPLLIEQVARAPRLAALRQMLGLRLEQRGDLPGAEDAFKTAIQTDGGTDTAWIALADHYARTKRPARAVELLNHVLQSAPLSADALVRSAAALQTLGQTEEAITRYERALVLRPRDIGIQNNLALLLADRKETRDRALSLAEAASQAMPNTPHLLDTLGYVHMRRGELDKALPLLRKSAAALPNLPEAQHHLGVALLLKGDQAGGRKLIEQARLADPGLPAAEQALRSAQQ